MFSPIFPSNAQYAIASNMKHGITQTVWSRSGREKKRNSHVFRFTRTVWLDMLFIDINVCKLSKVQRFLTFTTFLHRCYCCCFCLSFFLWVFNREIFNQSPLYQTNLTLSSVVMTTHRINSQYGSRRICYVWLLKYWAFNIRHNWMPQCVPHYLKSCVLFVYYVRLL